MNDYGNNEFLDESQRDENHERWIKQGTDDLQQLIQNVAQGLRLYINQQLLMLLTLEPHRLEYLRKAWNNLPTGWLCELIVDFSPSNDDHWCRVGRVPDHHCRNPPAEEALLATATELAQMFSSVDSLRHLILRHTRASMVEIFLAACPWLENVTIYSCPLVAANVRSMLSIKTLRRLEMFYQDFPDAESIDAFCVGNGNKRFEMVGDA